MTRLIFFNIVGFVSSVQLSGIYCSMKLNFLIYIYFRTNIKLLFDVHIEGCEDMCTLNSLPIIKRLRYE